MSFASKIRELRIRKALSLQQLADITGTSKAHLWELETGRSKNPTVEVLRSLSTALGATIADLVGETSGIDGDDQGAAVMFRDLKELSEPDREAIRMMIDRLRKRGGDSR